MPAIEYRITDIRDIELIRSLWVQLNVHHHARAKRFQSHYEQITFDDRKAYFEKVAAAGTFRVDIAWDPQAQKYVGYCISSLSQERHGEIESIFVEETYRSNGIGTILMHRALAWLDANCPVRIRVSVGDGNEEAFRFYRKFDFFSRMTVLEQKKG